MDIKLLGIIGSLGTATIGGGIYLAVGRSSNTIAISELFKLEKGLKLINLKDDSKWNEAWIRYREDHKNLDNQTYKDRDKWGLLNWIEKRVEGNAFEEFKRECERRAKLKVKSIEQQGYGEVKKYCARPKKISELLSEDKTRSLLDKSGDADLWNKSWKEYKGANIESGTGETVRYKAKDEWGVVEWSSKQSLDIAPEEYKTKCDDKLNDYIDPEKVTEDETFKQVKSWCTK